MSVYDPTFTGTVPPLYDITGVSPLLHVPLPGCGRASYTAVAPLALAVGVSNAPVAVKFSAGGVKDTPAGASPPALGLPIAVLVPAAAPSVQHTLAVPFTSVTVAAVDAYVAPQVVVASDCGVMTPPPSVTVQATGTF